MKKIQLELTVLTPMFLAGANGTTAEIRSSSIKGLLRFWWRAAQSETDNVKLKEKEGSIFGCVGKNSCKSPVLIRVTGNDQVSRFTSRDSLPKHNYQVKNFTLNILDYLAYGTYNYISKKNVFQRDYIKPDFSFNLILLWQNDKIKPDLLTALQYFCSFANLGAKSRNGFGSFMVTNISGDLSEKEKIQITTCPDFPQNKCLTGHCSFSKDFRLFQTKKQHKTWDSCLAELGFAYRNCRLKLEKPNIYIKRGYLAAPLKPYSKLERRSKPLFLIVRKKKDNYLGSLLFLPSHYCKGAEEKIKFKNVEEEHKKFLKVCQDINDNLAKELQVIK